MEKEKLKPFNDTEEQIDEGKDLILYNDDFNTFDFVIKSLIEICGHDPDQADDDIARKLDFCASKLKEFGSQTEAVLPREGTTEVV